MSDEVEDTLILDFLNGGERPSPEALAEFFNDGHFADVVDGFCAVMLRAGWDPSEAERKQLLEWRAWSIAHPQPDAGLHKSPEDLVTAPVFSIGTENPQMDAVQASVVFCKSTLNAALIACKAQGLDAEKTSDVFQEVCTGLTFGLIRVLWRLRTNKDKPIQEQRDQIGKILFAGIESAINEDLLDETQGQKPA